MPLNTNKKPNELAVLIGLGGGKRPERGAPPSMSAYAPKPVGDKLGAAPLEGAEQEEVASAPCIHSAMCPFYNKSVEGMEATPPSEPVEVA